MKSIAMDEKKTQITIQMYSDNQTNDASININ